MIKKILGSLLLLTFVHLLSHAQTGLVRGVIMDSSENITLPNSSVILLSAKDSFIVADTRASGSGRFEMEIPDLTQRYILLISYPDYVLLSRDILTV